MNKIEKCLVIGGAGFIGDALVGRLAEMGHSIRVLTRSKPAYRRPNIEYVLGSYLNNDDCAAALSGVDLCFNLASSTLPASSNEHVLYDLETNLRGTVQLLEQCVMANIGKIIYLSSGGTVYGNAEILPLKESHPLNPISAYGVSKAGSELYMNLYSKIKGLDCRIVRLANPYGPGQLGGKLQGAVPIFIRKILSGQPIKIWGDGHVIRDFLYISDAVEAITRVAFSDSKTKTFNVGSGVGHSLNDLISMIEKAVGKAATVEYGRGREFDVGSNVLDCNLAFRELNWRCTLSLSEGIVFTLKGITSST